MKYFVVSLLFLFPVFVFAQEIDTDGDGISDQLEIDRYYLDPNNPDTDGDGYNDNDELLNGFSPHQAGKRLIEVDQDWDGLSDGYELSLRTDLKNPDTDGDGYTDGDEFFNEYDPTTAEPIKLKKSIGIDLSDQRLWYQLGSVILNKFVVSTGSAVYPTPIGEFKIENQFARPFSQRYGLFMPFWMSIGNGYGIHELPEWPGGYKEGAEHLGTPVSHGCIRLSPEGASELYAWADVGTPVIINE